MANGGEWHTKFASRDKLNKWLSLAPDIAIIDGKTTIRIDVSSIQNIVEKDVPPDDDTQDNYSRYFPPTQNVVEDEQEETAESA